MRGVYSIAIFGMALIAFCGAQNTTETPAVTTEAMQNDGTNAQTTTAKIDTNEEKAEVTPGKTSTVPPLNHTSAGNNEEAAATTMKPETTKTTKSETTQVKATEKPNGSGSYVIQSSLALLILSVLSAIYQS